MFQSFPIVYYMEVKNYKSAYFREFLYYLLSATSKLFLGIILTFNVFLDGENDHNTQGFTPIPTGISIG